MYGVYNGLNMSLESLIAPHNALNQIRTDVYQHNLKQCGIYLNQGRLVVILVSLPILLFNLFSGKIMQKYGYDEKVCN